ncbi:nicotinamide-nucleotide amidase [Rhodoglobus vestalii]|uniref:Nicotinamide-nucleotide amidase n=1 Tax=Rhodoglobus vestalii TaxID=193384 RepID=A0A8H2PXM7_9MICO|nr:CinA family protein [Rhodoglobus vestalii]TQO18938.1 nicotinamide-nucleotide amidase [Rhodoglobus vestalii]
MIKEELATKIVTILTEQRQTIALAESLTGGLLCASLVAVPGASVVLNGAVVAYNAAIKRQVLGVDASLLAIHGTVHPDVAAHMATGARDVLGIGQQQATYGLATTGVAGPESHEGKIPGTVFIGFAANNFVETRNFEFVGDRDAVRQQAVQAALECLHDHLVAES